MTSSFSTTREILAPAEAVFAAISNPERLARWWGPQGFTNTFDVCEFKAGGRWSFVMHAPDGANYRNEAIFAEIAPPSALIIQHLSEPRFRLTILLAKSSAGTRVSWRQEFESVEVARALEKVVVPANEQNLDRLTVEVERGNRA